MNVSIVLWNCYGRHGVDERRDECTKVITSWKEDDEIPTVVLAQEVSQSGVFRTDSTPWESFSKYDIKDFKDESDAVCIYPTNSNGDEFVLSPDEFLNRIHCSILRVEHDKILMCSWHGPQNHPSRKARITTCRSMLTQIDRMKETTECQIVLVGGDYNLFADCAKAILSSDGMPKGAKLYHWKEDCLTKFTLKDYLIAWPSNRISERRCSVVETETNAFDHKVIRHDLTLRLTGEWKGGDGNGEVKWKGDWGEGNISIDEEGQVEFKTNQDEGELNNKSCGSWSGEAKGCITMQDNDGKQMEIEWDASGKGSWTHNDVVSLKCQEGSLKVKWEGRGIVKWRGKTEAKWVGGKLSRWKNQTVEWTDNQRVQWEGKGKVTFDGGKLKVLSIESSNPNELQWKYSPEQKDKWTIVGSNNQQVKFEDDQITKWHGEGKITFNNGNFEIRPTKQDNNEAKLVHGKFKQTEIGKLRWKAGDGLTWNIKGHQDFKVECCNDDSICWSGKGKIELRGRNLSDQISSIKTYLQSDTEKKLTWQGEEMMTWKVEGHGTGKNKEQK